MQYYISYIRYKNVIWYISFKLIAPWLTSNNNELDVCHLRSVDIGLPGQEEEVPQAETQTFPHQTHGEGLRQEPLVNPLNPDSRLCGLHSRHSQKRERNTPKYYKDWCSQTKVTCARPEHPGYRGTHTGNMISVNNNDLNFIPSVQNESRTRCSHFYSKHCHFLKWFVL